MYVLNVAPVEQNNTILCAHSLLEPVDAIAMMANLALDHFRHSNVDIVRSRHTDFHLWFTQGFARVETAIADFLGQSIEHVKVLVAMLSSP